MTSSPPPHYRINEPSDQRPQSGPPHLSQTGEFPTQPVPSPAETTMLQPARPEPKSPLLWLMAAAALLCVGVAALAFTLWIQTRADLSEAETQLEERADEVAGLEDDLAASEDRNGELESGVEQQEALQACVDDVAWWYGTEVDSAEEDEAWDSMLDSCADWL